MNLLKPTALTAAALAAGLFLLHAPGAFAQAPNPPSVAATPAPAAPPEGPGGPGGGDRREEFRQRMAERIKAQLKASDDEWSVIQPLLEKAAEKLQASRGGGGFPGGPGGRENRRGGGNNAGGNPAAGAPQQAAPAPDNAQGGGGGRQRREGGGGMRGGSPETQALAAALADDNSTVNDIKTKLQAVRDQRKKAAAELTQAREDLRKVLNMRQEAALVMDGILD